MTHENDPANTRISNWTLATGQLPGRRDVQGAVVDSAKK